MSYPIETRSRSGRQQKNKINLPPDQRPSHTLQSLHHIPQLPCHVRYHTVSSVH
jgi:hypothetical protein